MTRSPEDQLLIDELTERTERAERRILDHAGELSRLRHDLRGILSPALLLADRLLTSSDPIAQRTAQVVIQTIERAEAALAKKP